MINPLCAKKSVAERDANATNMGPELTYKTRKNRVDRGKTHLQGCPLLKKMAVKGNSHRTNEADHNYIIRGGQKRKMRELASRTKKSVTASEYRIRVFQGES